jgi:imidazolonepropionase-like amidohydrolase
MKTAVVRSLRAGWVISGDGGAVMKNRLLRVVNGRLDTLSGFTAKEACRVDHDLSAYTLIPRLVDSHVHLTMSGSGDPALREKQLEYRFDEAIPVIAGHLAAHFRSGILAVRDGGDRRGHTRRYLVGGGDTSGVRVRYAGRAIKRKGRYGALIGRDVDSKDSLIAAVVEEIQDNHHLKLVNSGLNSLERFGWQSSPQFGAGEISLVVAQGRKRNKPVMVHANGELPVRLAVEAGCTSIEHGFFMGRDNLGRMAENRTWWVPTACTMDAYAKSLKKGSPEVGMARRNLEHQLEQLQLARRYGVLVAAGTDAGSLGVYHGRALAVEIGLLMESGYTIQEAVRCASVNGAALLGIRDGWALCAGHPAVFLAVPGPPETLVPALGQACLWDLRQGEAPSAKKPLARSNPS